MRDEALSNSRKSVLFDEMEVMYDIVFVMNANSRGWILEKICKVIERESSLNCGYVYSERNDKLTYPLPKARAYFFAHYALAFSTMARVPEVFGADRFVWFTHPDVSKGMTLDDMGAMLNLCTHVFTPCSINRRLLALVGVDSSRISVPLGGADPDVFKPHTRGNGVVGFVGAYYPRKMPDKMLDLMRAMPDVEFILVGPGPDDVANRGLLWSSWSRFGELINLPNLTYVEASYDDYPRYFGEMDVYVSLSELEGGPIPVIEAMMSNVIPVATRTGFAEDVIDQGGTGYVIPIEADPATISYVIRQALARADVDVRTQALDYSWSNFARAILERMMPSAKEGVQTAIGQTQESHRFLRQGWHAPDRSGAWMSASSARLKLPMQSVETGTKSVTVNLWTAFPAGQDAPFVSLSVNGQTIARRQLPPMESTEITGTFELPADRISRPIEISIDVSHLAEVEIAGAKRKSGVKLAWVKLDDANIRASEVIPDLVSRPDAQRRAVPASELAAALAKSSEISLPVQSANDDTWVESVRGMLANIGWLRRQPAPRVAEPLAAASPAPANVVVVGAEKLNFVTGSAVVRHLRDGWWEPEPHGVWTRGRIGDLQLWLDTAASSNAELEVEGRVIGARCPDGENVAIQVHLGGEATSHVDIKFSSDEMALMRIPLPQLPADWAGAARISFRRAASFMPSEIDPSSADHRDLGFYLSSIRVTPLSTHGALR
ncbi:MAG: glycosyltransferase [Proteobacteria bacterium]|nr:glycosyltransferase [Pseudomonadota bacterium]